MEPEEKTVILRKRPFLLMVFCVFSFVFYGSLGLLLLGGTFYSGYLLELINDYSPGEPTGQAYMSLSFLGTSIAHFTAFGATVFIWKRRKAGYIVFCIAAIAIAIYHLFLPDISLLVTSIHISLVVVFGLFYNFYQL